MRHKNSKLLLNRNSSWRKATVDSLAKNLLTYESIKTTAHRAKVAKPLVEQLISLARANTLSARRQAFSILRDHGLVSALFKEIGPRFKTEGGFTRVIGIGKRRGDDARLVIFELTVKKPKEVKKEKKERKAEEKPQAERPATGEKRAAEPEAQAALKEKPPATKKPAKKFFGGLRNIFKKERDSL